MLYHLSLRMWIILELHESSTCWFFWGSRSACSFPILKLFGHIETWRGYKIYMFNTSIVSISYMNPKISACTSIFHSMFTYHFLIYLCRGFWRSFGNCVLYDFLFSDNIYGYVESLATDDGSIGRFCYRLLSKYDSLCCLYTWLNIPGKFCLQYCDYILV